MAPLMLLVASLVAPSPMSPVQAAPAAQAVPTPPAALVPTAAYYLPRPIQKADLEEWAVWLNLATPQVLTLENMWAGYSQQWELDLKKSRTELDRYALHLGALSAGEVGPDFVTAVGALRGSERSASLTLAALDDRLFADLEAVLADVQKEGMVRLRASRDRVVGLSQPFMIPGAPVDLRALVSQLGLREDLRAQLDGCLAEYDSRIAPELLRLREAQWRNAVPVDRLSVELAAASKIRDRNAVKSLSAQRSSLLRSASQIERRIATINGEFCDRLEQLLPMPLNETLRAAFDAKAYPTLFPDMSDPSRLVRQMVDSASLPDDELNAVRTILDSYRARRDEINRRICANQDEADDRFASTLTSHDRAKFEATFADLQAKRLDAHRTALKQVAAIIPSPIQMKYSRELAYARAQVASGSK